MRGFLSARSWVLVGMDFRCHFILVSDMSEMGSFPLRGAALHALEAESEWRIE
jgi:hypothetical protein